MTDTPDTTFRSLAPKLARQTRHPMDVVMLRIAGVLPGNPTIGHGVLLTSLIAGSIFTAIFALTDPETVQGKWAGALFIGSVVSFFVLGVLGGALTEIGKKRFAKTATTISVGERQALAQAVLKEAYRIVDDHSLTDDTIRQRIQTRMDELGHPAADLDQAVEAIHSKARTFQTLAEDTAKGIVSDDSSEVVQAMRNLVDPKTGLDSCARSLVMKATTDPYALVSSLIAKTEIEKTIESRAGDQSLARHQPCGCVVCICDEPEQCQGCGAKNCGTHPPGEIPDPVYE